MIFVRVGQPSKEAACYYTGSSFVKKFNFFTMKREAAVLSALSDSGVTPRYLTHGSGWVEMEYLAGYRPLSKLTRQEIKTLLPAIAKALKRVHSYGVLHLDLHMNNVLVKGKEVRIIDFNRSRLTTPDRCGYDVAYLANNLCSILGADSKLLLEEYKKL